MKINLLVLFVLLICILQISAENPFVVIMYDSLTEKHMGSFPPNRKVWSDTINKLVDNNAKAIVLKFFFDLPKPEDEDLGKSISLIPTFLQACINENEPSSNVFESRFIVKSNKHYTKVISGNNGWLPVPVLANKAYDIGFVDLRDINEIPVLEKYNNQYVKSLYFSVLQYIYPELMLVNNSLVNHNKKIKLNKYLEMHVQYPNKDDLSYISLSDFLNNKIDGKIFKDKIIIIGYDGMQSPQLTISTGNVNTHRVFIYGLYDMYKQLQEK